MSYTESTRIGFNLLCDECELPLNDEGDFFSSKEAALDATDDAGWLVTPSGKHYCEDCRGAFEQGANR